jgi:hypothetical protein
MTNPTSAEQRIADAVTNRPPLEIDRFEDEGGPGPGDTRQRSPGDRQVVPTDVAQPNGAVSIAAPQCALEHDGMQETAGAEMAADPTQVIVTSGATAHSVQVHHHGIPELHSHGDSPESATVNLAQELTREIDSAADKLHREPLQRALGDVEACIEESA